MGATALISFRESLEASLVIGLILAVLGRSERRGLASSVWAGLAAGIVVSLAVAFAFLRLLGQFEGRAEQIFEGSVMAFGSLLLATLILWTGSHASGRRLEGKAESAIAGGWLGLAALVFVSVLREGVETVIYLGAGLKDAGPAYLLAGLGGILLALVVGLLIFRAGARISSRLLFGATTVLLLLFGAGLFGRAAGEFGEAGLLPALVPGLWNLAPEAPGAPLPLLADEGALGSFLKGLFGYVASPSLMQVLAYVAYLVAVFTLLGLGRRKPVGPGR